jgi:hypothetical protein
MEPLGPQNRRVAKLVGCWGLLLQGKTRLERNRNRDGL